MIGRPHRSIGEVLSLLQTDFPDITISKIRFLESQGLLDPERTPSGYRKFYETDITKLQWILEQQRDHFLPLRVIKEKLVEGGGEPPAETTVPSIDEVLTEIAAHSNGGSSGMTVAGTAVAGAGAVDAQGAHNDNSTTRAAESSGTSTTRSANFGSVSMTPEELAAASNLDREAIDQLEKFGMLSSRSAGSTQIYDDEALLVAKLAAAFLARGLEPRHLRMYKLAADREADVFEQLVTPRLKGGSIENRAEVTKTVHDMTSLGSELRAAMLRQSLRGVLPN